MVNRIVPHESLYTRAERLNKYSEILLYFSTVLSIAISVLSYYELERDLQKTLIVINSLIIGLFIFLDSRANLFYAKAETKRRLDWLDNSFDTNFGGKKSQNYFTNEHLSPGLYKLAVNCFENSLHTEFILSKMTPRVIIQTIVIVICFVVSSYFGNSETIRMFFELGLPVYLILKMFKVITFSNRISDVHDRFKLLFSDLKNNGYTNKTAEALRDVLEYETALSWASTPLSSKVFFKYKDHLADEWEELKKDYKINL